MGRPMIQVDQNSLTTIINRCEANKTYRNHSELFKDVASLYNDQHKTTLTPAIIYLRVNEWGIVLKTEKGKKGRQKGDGPAISLDQRAARQPRSDKFAASKVAQQSLGLLRAEVKREQNGRFLPLVKRLEGGSMKAAVALKCLDCCAGSVVDIKHCPCTSCPLYLFRPYQHKSEEVLTSQE